MKSTDKKLTQNTPVMPAPDVALRENGRDEEESSYEAVTPKGCRASRVQHSRLRLLLRDDRAFTGTGGATATLFQLRSSTASGRRRAMAPKVQRGTGSKAGLRRLELAILRSERAAKSARPALDSSATLTI